MASSPGVAPRRPCPSWYRAAAMPNGPGRLLLIAVAGMLLALVGHLGLLLVGGVAGVGAPMAIEYGEPFIVSAAHNAASGGRLYAPVDDLPFLHNNYNPLVQLAVGPWLSSTGVSFVPLRAVTLISVLAILGVAAWLIRRTTRSGVAAAIGGLLPLTCGFMFPWMCVGRVDAFATAASCAAFAWAVCHEHKPLRARAWFLLFAWVAFAAKQSVVGGCGAALLYGFLRGRRLESLALGLVFTAGCGAFVGVAHLLTDGQHWLHAVTYNASHDRGGWWPQTLSPLELLQAIGWPLLLSLCWVARAVRREDLPWMCWFAVTLPLGFLLVRKSGAHVHYFLEAVTALSVLVTAVGSRIVTAARTPRSARFATVALVAIALATIPGTFWSGPSTWRSGAWFKWAQARELARLSDAADPIPPDVRRRIEGTEFPPLLLAQTATVAIECGRSAIFDVADFARLQQLGRWDSAGLLALVAARRFPVVAIQDFGGDLETEALFGLSAIAGLEGALEEHYVPLEQPYRDRRGKTGTFWVPKS